MKSYYAHSGDIKNGIMIPQLYEDHVKNVCSLSSKFIEDCCSHTKFNAKKRKFITECVNIAAYWHDVGKLDDNIQIHLCKNEYANEKILNHVDAGVGITLKYFENTQNVIYLVAAFLIQGHHIGLQNWEYHINERRVKGFVPKTNYEFRKFRDNSIISDLYTFVTEHLTVEDYINSNMNWYVAIQGDIMGYIPIPTDNYKSIDLTAMDIRVMFSCLVDADHSDTDVFYGGDYTLKIYNDLSPKKRLEKLIRYTTRKVKSSVKSVRNDSRTKLFNIAIENSNLSGMINFEAPVGTGKTLACIGKALKMAEHNKCDRIINILPFTQVISQTVNVYRKCVLLPKEHKWNINEIHSKVEFDEPRLRKNSKLWKSPINISTAVQFFESLVSNKPSACRKIHWFVNSVIIFDEYDKALPHSHWNYISQILLYLHNNYNIHIIFSSGTPTNYFNIFNIDNPSYQCILDKPTWDYYQLLEDSRITNIFPKNKFNTLGDLRSYVVSEMTTNSSNNSLIVVNTIINALQVFIEFKNNCGDYKVYHLSSALTPNDKESVIKAVNKKLSNNEKVILVSTSIIECGVDISFDIGFREEAALGSILQFNGRINRNSTNINGKVHIFGFDDSLVNRNSGILTENPSLRNSVQILNKIKTHGKITPEYCEEAVQLEIANSTDLKFNDKEYHKAFRIINEDFNVISSSTMVIIINKTIVEKIKQGKYVPSTEISRNSIQLWTAKFNDIVNKIGGIGTIEDVYGNKHFTWDHPYDPAYFGIGQTLLQLRA